MVQLPEEFIQQTRELMGEERFARYLAAFDEEPPVSIRLNPQKVKGALELCSLATKGTQEGWKVKGEYHSPLTTHQVPWCPLGIYLSERPNFTFDPLLHAGCYYVQEAASMFIHHILTTHLSPLTTHPSPLKVLDLCAAPGGKSTCAISALPEGTQLWANEPVRQRASILLENITKWGYPDCTVTNSYPRDYARSGLTFDIILCDVPCSGEGMFRKDPQTISEWSLQNVEKCWRLQRDIVSDAWQCLRPGGLLIYSTCTFNTKENEENVRWMLEHCDADILPVETRPEWNITGSLLPGFDAPVYRFIPGITRSEGLFICVLRKRGEWKDERGKKNDLRQKQGLNILSPLTTHHSPLTTHLSPLTTHHSPLTSSLSYSDAIAYLRGEALTLPPDTPRGIVTVSFMGHPLGQMKNIGSRANNLYPKEWRIKSTHVPQEYQPVIDLGTT